MPILLDGVTDGGLPADLPQCHENTHGQQSAGLIQPWSTSVDFVSRRFIIGRGAVANRRNRTVGKYQSVLARRRFRLVGKSCLEQRTKQPVAATISREHPPGAISPMRAGRQANDQQPCACIAKVGNRTSPVYIVSIGAPLCLCDSLAMRPQPWTPVARDDALIQRIPFPVGRRRRHRRPYRKSGLARPTVSRGLSTWTANG